MLKYILSVPVIIFPYTLLLGMYCLYTPTIMETVFKSNVILLAGALALFGAAAFAFSCIVGMVVIVKVNDALAAARLNMIIKLIHMPAYVAIFVLGMAFFVTVFGIPFVMFFVLFDCAAIAMSGIIGASSVIRGFLEGRLDRASAITFAIMGFVFVGDIVIGIMNYVALKRSRRGKTAA